MTRSSEAGSRAVDRLRLAVIVIMVLIASAMALISGRSSSMAATASSASAVVRVRRRGQQRAGTLVDVCAKHHDSVERFQVPGEGLEPAGRMG